MKKFFLGFALLAWLLSGGDAFATVGMQEDGVSIGTAIDINCSTGITCTSDGSLVTMSGGAVGTDGNWTSDGLAVSLDLAPTKFIATASSGDFSATGFTVGTGDLTFAQGGKIDGDTNNVIKLIENSDTLSFGFTGTTITLDSSDGGFQFKMTDATEGQIDFLTNNDTDDYMSITTTSNVPTIITTGTANLAIIPDGGTVAITGGLTVSSGLTASSTITLQNAETIANATNQTVRVSSNAASPILEVYDPGTSNTSAMLKLTADAAGDNGDTWAIVSDGSTNALLFQNNTSGSLATVFSVPTTGIITLTAALTLSNGETIVNSTDDTVNILSDDLDTTVRVTGFEAKFAAIELCADQCDDTADKFTLKASTTDVLSILNGSTTLYSMTSAGVLTLPDSETLTNASDVVQLDFDDAAGSFVVAGFEASGSSISIDSDQGDDAADVFKFSMDAADLMTITTGSTTAATVSTAGLWTVAAETITGASLHNGNTTLGDAITDITTFTGKIAGATPLSFDGNTADTVYTIIAVDDAASSSKTVSIPAVTGYVQLSSAAVAITAGATPTVTVARGTTYYTDTITTDNQDQTLTPSAAGSAGDEMIIRFVTDTGGSNDEVITFASTFVSTGTLTLANLTANSYMIKFFSDGSKWREQYRTAAQA